MKKNFFILVRERPLRKGEGFKGLRQISCIESRRRAFRMPKGDFDLILLTSAKTVEYLSSLPKAKKFEFVGEETKRAAIKKFNRRFRSRPYDNLHDLIQALRPGQGRSVFFPRSAQADRNDILTLRRKGYRVEVVHPYGLVKKNQRRFLARVSESAERIYFFVTSPSQARSLYTQVPRGALKKAVWIAIGQTTAKEIRKFRIRCRVSPHPTMRAMKALVQRQISNLEA